MKSVIVTDTHCGLERGKSNLLKLFDYIYRYATDNEIKTLIHLGDYWHNRKSINIQSLLVGLAVADNINTVFNDAYIVTGNHDTIYKDDIKVSLLSVFKKHDNIFIVNEPWNIGNILMLPWLFDPEYLKNNDNFDILLGHFDINGCNMNSAGTQAEGARFNTGDFNNFKLVLSGHYHTPGTYGNIRYLGSPYHMSFNDVDSTRGFYILDSDNASLDFVEFNDYPKYHRVRDIDLTEVFDPTYVKDNIVELIFTNDYGIDGNTKIIERVENMRPHTLIPKYVNISESMSQEDIAQEDMEIKNHLGILKEYYEYSEQPEHINIKMLNKMVEKIYEDTINGT